MMVPIDIDKIRTDGGTQPRAVIDFEAVRDYADDMRNGARFPPLVVFYDGAEYWLADGFHRIMAASQLGLKEIECDVHQGTQADAQWHSFAANAKNGLRRTNEDKQRAIRAALVHSKAAGMSDRQIAVHVGTDHKTVGAWRERLLATGEIPQSAPRLRTGLDGRTIDTSNIGKSPAARLSELEGLIGMRLHPLNALFPLITGQEYRAFVESIRECGLLEPIVIHKGEIVDGKIRFLACREAGVEPRFVEWRTIQRPKSGEPEAKALAGFIWSVNVERMHLTPDQRACVAAEAAETT